MASTRRAIADARQHHTAAVATLQSGAEPHEKRLGLPPAKQALRDGLGRLRANHRSLQGRLELAHHRPRPNNLNRQPRMGMGQCPGGLV